MSKREKFVCHAYFAFKQKLHVNKQTVVCVFEKTLCVMKSQTKTVCSWKMSLCHDEQKRKMCVSCMFRSLTKVDVLRFDKSCMLISRLLFVFLKKRHVS